MIPATITAFIAVLKEADFVMPAAALPAVFAAAALPVSSVDSATPVTSSASFADIEFACIPTFLHAPQ